ncbi:MAG: PEP-CTERM sorting domain-containing protein [Myxococcales bacterium]|nr:PEP-CTERM sorting domain-containing protein [Myxococcales bacterium]
MNDNGGNSTSTQCFTTVPEPGVGWALALGTGLLWALQRRGRVIRST